MPAVSDPVADLRKAGRYALAGLAYQRGTVRLASRDLSGCEHLVATRHGLFAANERAHRLIAHGLFYGLTVVGDAIWAFEAGDRPREPSVRGRIVRFDRDGDRIAEARVVATGLDNGCHQIDMIRGELCVVDTYNQRIVALAPDGSSRRVLTPLPSAGDRYAADYAHINSLVAHDGGVLLLLHNGGGEGPAPVSEVAVLDAEWRVVSRSPLAGHGCHNLVPLDDGTLLACGSMAGELIGSDGTRVRLGDMMTRGLSVDAERVVVGGSTFSARDIRDGTGGAVWFLDRTYALRATLAMPAPVMEIRRIDGRDRSLSPFLAASERI